MKLITIYFFLTLCVSFGISACKPSLEIAPDRTFQREAEVTLSFQVPGKVRPMTYALDQADENVVESIDVLVFNTDNEFQYRVRSYTITSSGANGYEKHVTLKMVPGTAHLTVLANASTLLDQVFPMDIAVGTAKSAVLDQLIVQHSGPWNTNPMDAAYVPIPMWGEYQHAEIQPGANVTGDDAISLVRMLARIDVKLGAGVVDNFILSSIRLYHPLEAGHLIPATDETTWDAMNHQVLLPTVPAGAGFATAPLLYGATELTTPDEALSGVLYTFEANKASIGNLDQATCLVVGGAYQGGNTTYYRIDFARTESGVTTFLDLLRNHIYTVTITDVAGAGYATPEEALQANGVNIASEVVEWNDSDLSDIVSDGQYVLGVSTTQLTLPATLVNNHIWVNTTYPAGIIASSSASWLVLTQSSLPGDDQRSALSYIATANGTGQIRSAVITLTAGRLIKEITVTQAY